MNNSYYKGYTIGYLTKEAQIGAPGAGGPMAPAVGAPPPAQPAAPPAPAPSPIQAPPDVAAPQGAPTSAPVIPGMTNSVQGAQQAQPDPMEVARQKMEGEVAEKEQQAEMLGIENQGVVADNKLAKEQAKQQQLQQQKLELEQGITQAPA